MTGRNELVAAAGAGCFATILGHPLDCIKVHMQTQPHLARSGTLATAASLLGVGGPRSFIRGLAPPLLNAVLMNTLMFTAFNEAKRALEVHTTWGSGTVGALVAGALSGLATAFLSTPMDWVKVQAQLRGSLRRFGSASLQNPGAEAPKVSMKCRIAGPQAGVAPVIFQSTNSL